MTNWIAGAWTCRKSHLITASAGAGTNYQVGIKVYKTTGSDGTETVNGTVMGKVYVGSSCRDDFGDIRFTDNDGETELDYWLDDTSLVSSTSCIFWVEVKDTLESNATIFIYYNKADETTTSNGANTFRLFDHFNDESLDTALWDAAGTGTATETGTELTVTSGTANTNHKYVTSDATYATGVAVEARVKVTTTGGAAFFGMTSVVASLADKTYTHGMYKHVSYANFAWGSGNDTSASLVQYATVKNANYHRTSIKRSGTADSIWLDAEENSGTEYPTANNRYVNMDCYCITSGAVTMVVDWVAVRKYIASEPAHSTWGTEEIERTITYVTDVLLKKLKITKSCNIDVKLEKLGIIKTDLIDVLLIEIPITTNNIDVLLKKLGLTTTNSIDVLFKKLNITKTNLIDVLFKKIGVTKTNSIDVLFKKFGVIKTYDIDILISLKDKKEIYDVDILLKKQGLTKTELVDVIFKKLGLTNQTQIDTVFKKLGVTGDYSIDTQFCISNASQYNIDVVLKKIGIEKSYVIDTQIISIETNDYSLDVLFLKNISKPYSIDVIILNKGGLPYSIDAIFKKLGISKDYLIDAMLKKNNISLAYVIDVIAQKLGIIGNYNIDTVFKKLGVIGSYSLDTMFKKLGIPLSYSLDVVLQEAVGIPILYVIDTLFKKMNFVTHSIDVLLKEKYISIDYLIDVLLHYYLASSYNIDVILKRPKNQVNYLLDVILISTIIKLYGGGQPEERYITVDYIDRNFIIRVKPLKVISTRQKQKIFIEELKVRSEEKNSKHKISSKLNIVVEKTYTVPIIQPMILRKYSFLTFMMGLQISIDAIIQFNVYPLEIIKSGTKKIDTSSLNILREMENVFSLSALDSLSEIIYSFSVTQLSTKKKKTNKDKRKEIMNMLDMLEKEKWDEVMDLLDKLDKLDD